MPTRTPAERALAVIGDESAGEQRLGEALEMVGIVGNRHEQTIAGISETKRRSGAKELSQALATIRAIGTDDEHFGEAMEIVASTGSSDQQALASAREISRSQQHRS